MHFLLMTGSGIGVLFNTAVLSAVLVKHKAMGPSCDDGEKIRLVLVE